MTLKQIQGAMANDGSHYVTLTDGVGNLTPITGGSPTGYSNLATGQVSVGTTATVIAAARTGRGTVTVANGATAIYVGNSGVTTTTGILVPVNGNLTLTFNGAVYGIVATGTSSVTYSESY